jgi:hypothetical protein
MSVPVTIVVRRTNRIVERKEGALIPDDGDV